MKINGTKQLYSVAHQHYDPYMRGVHMLLHDVFNPRIYGVFTKKDNELIIEFDDKDKAYVHKRKMLIQGVATYVQRVK